MPQLAHVANANVYWTRCEPEARADGLATMIIQIHRVLNSLVGERGRYPTQARCPISVDLLVPAFTRISPSSSAQIQRKSEPGVLRRAALQKVSEDGKRPSGTVLTDLQPKGHLASRGISCGP